jgi:predicted ATPase
MDIGPITVKGKSQPVRTYEVIGPKALPGKLRGLAGLESPMVGRDAELATLVQLSSAVHAGLGRAALIIGEAGLGKSRLIAEWRNKVVEEEEKSHHVHDEVHEHLVNWAEGHCLSYGQGLAYHLLIDLLHSVLGLPGTASEAERRAALQASSEDLFGDSSHEIYSYLGHILSLQLEPSAEEMVKMLDPQSLQTQYLGAIRQLLGAISARHPLILVLDDIHWADPSSIELLIKLVPMTFEAAVLFCCVTRPDRESPGWKLVTALRETVGAGLAEFNLQSLSEADSRQLIANLLEIEELPENIRNIILMKAEGNPFFVEEVIRMLIDRGIIIRKNGGWVAQKEIEMVDIPDNLQGLLLARIDRLPEEVKRTLRIASVIGRQFSVKVLEQVLSTQGR